MSHPSHQPSTSKYFSSPQTSQSLNAQRSHQNNPSHQYQHTISSHTSRPNRQHIYSPIVPTTNTATESPQHHHSRHQTPTIAQPPRNQNSAPSDNAILDLLPFCTTDSERLLSKEQVIGLSDVAGNLKEVVLLALRASVDEEAARVLEGAVGKGAVTGVVEFWSDEFVVE